MEALIAPIASGVISAVVAAFGCYVALTNRLTKLETMIDTLTKTVEKHNQVVERTYKIESDLHTVFKHIDLLRDDIDRRENVKIGGSQ